MRHLKHNHRTTFRDDNGSYNLQLSWEELTYDIRMILHRRSRPAVAAGEMPSVNTISEDDDDYLARIYTEALADIHNELAAYVRQDSRMASDEIDEIPEYYNIRMHFDPDWRGSAKAMCDTAHAYLVSKALAELLAIAGDSLASQYIEKAQKALVTLRDEAGKYNIEDPIIFRL